MSNNGQIPPQTPPQQQATFKLGMEPPSVLDLNPEPTYWVGIESIKTAQSPKALLNSARLGDGHSLATALWICTSITAAMLFQQMNGMAQQVQFLTQKVEELEKKIREHEACHEAEA